MLFGLWKKQEGWPYPRGKRQTIEVAVVAMGILVVAAAGWGVWQWRASRSPLSSDEIQIAADDLSGYAGEALLLARGTNKQPLAANYRAAYLQQLQKNTSQTAKDLTKNPPEPHDSQRVAQLLQLEHELSGLVGQLDKSQKLEPINQLEALQTDIQKVEDKR